MADGKFGRPDPATLREFHINDDVDASNDAHHHTIGTGVNQASSGAHTHDGNDSPLLLEGVTITGTRGSASCDASIISALMKLGASDSTT